MAIDIPVSANFNDGQIKSQIAQINSQIKSLGAAVAAANKQKFEPISLRSKDDLKAYVHQTQQLLKLQTELKKRMQETGQGGKMPLAADWTKLYPNAQQRNRKLQEVLGFYGNDFEDIAPKGGGRPPLPSRPSHQPPPGTSPNGGGGGRFWGGIAQRGLAAGGPLGSTAGGAINAGMSGGGMGAAMRFGLAGLLAFGVGKAISGVVGKIGTAEDNEVAYDTLKRNLGDVSVAFSQLKTVVKATGDQHKVTYSESARLSMLYGKSGNLSGLDYRSMGGEVGTGIGLSRSYGLDPSQGVGMLGMMRGLGITRNETETRRFALLIGETIGKSKAFSKADEMMEAISNYAVMQARSSLSNSVGSYADQLSGLMGVRAIGLDAAGSAGLLSRIDGALRGGGAKGEASQFFSAGIGAMHGLDPFELRMLREGGAGASLSSTFGRGSTASSFGFRQREGDETFLTMSLKALRERYEKNGPGVLAEATANHFGITMAQAIAAQQIQTGQSGIVEAELAKSGFNLRDLNASAISGIGQVASGTAEQRMDIARQLYGRKDLSEANRIILNDVMQSGDSGRQTTELIRMLASYGQEDTQGKDIRDTKVGIDNLNTSLAERLIPLTQGIRDGVMYLATIGGNLSPMDIQKSLIDLDLKQEKKLIDTELLGGVKEADSKAWQLEKDLRYRENEIARKKARGLIGGEEAIEQIDAARLEAFEARENHGRLKARYEERIALAEAERDKRIKELTPSTATTSGGSAGTPNGWIPTSGASGGLPNYRSGIGLPSNYGLGGAGGAGGAGASGDLFRSLIMQESGGKHYAPGGGLLTSKAGARGISQLMPGTARDPGFGVRPAQDESEEEYLRVGREYLDALLRYYGGDRKKALAAYNAGPGNVDKAIAKHGSDWLSSMSRETKEYVPSVLGRVEGYNTQVPSSGSSGGQNGYVVSAEPLQVNVNVNGPGTATAQPYLQTTVGPAMPHR